MRCDRLVGEGGKEVGSAKVKLGCFSEVGINGCGFSFVSFLSSSSSGFRHTCLLTPLPL